MPVEGEEWVLQITKRHKALRIAVLSCVMLAAFAWPSAHAVETTEPVFLSGGKPQAGGGYFVDIRARLGPYIFGHTFIVYGRLNAHGKIVEAKIVGFSPDSDRYWPALFIPVRGLVDRQKSDIKTVSNTIYRRYLTAAEFHQLDAKVRQFRATKPAWHLLFNNCNHFVGEIAKSIGLHSPSSLMLPPTYVVRLHDLNDH
jgi:hypothetical protein